MGYTDTWDEAFPPDTQPARLLGQDIRSFKSEIRERLGTFLSDVLANRPTPEAIWAGLVFFATDTGQLFRWSGSAWVLLGVNTIGPLGSVVTIDPTPPTPGQVIAAIDASTGKWTDPQAPVLITESVSGGPIQQYGGFPYAISGSGISLPIRRVPVACTVIGVHGIVFGPGGAASVNAHSVHGDFVAAPFAAGFNVWDSAGALQNVDLDAGDTIWLDFPSITTGAGFPLGVFVQVDYQH